MRSPKGRCCSPFLAGAVILPMALGLLAGVVLQYSSSLRPGGGAAQGTLRLFDAVLSGMPGQPFPQGSHQAAVAAEVKQLITQAGHSGSPDIRLGGLGPEQCAPPSSTLTSL